MSIYNGFEIMTLYLGVIEKKAEDIVDGDLDDYSVVIAATVKGFKENSYLDIEVLAAYVEDCSVCGKKRVEKLNEEFPGCVIFVLPMTEYILIQQNEAKFNS